MTPPDIEPPHGPLPPHAYRDLDDEPWQPPRSRAWSAVLPIGGAVSGAVVGAVAGLLFRFDLWLSAGVTAAAGLLAGAFMGGASEEHPRRHDQRDHRHQGGADDHERIERGVAGKSGHCGP